MNKPKLLTIFFIISFLNSGATIASEHHSGHGGGNKGGGGSGGSSCEKARVGKFLPPQMATVSPEGEFSFWLSMLTGRIKFMSR